MSFSFNNMHTIKVHLIILFIRKIGERDGRVSSSVGSTGGAEAAKGSEWLVA